MKFNVRLDIFRGANARPIGQKQIAIDTDSALTACCRAEELLNVTVADNEYAAARSVWPLINPSPQPAMALALAA